MKRQSAPRYALASLNGWTRLKAALFLRTLDLRQLRLIRHDFEFWSHDAQRPPDGDWRTWLFLGGRGSGKTRAGAEWVKRQAVRGGRRRIALIAPTLHDMREVMVDGASGLMRGRHAPIRYDVSRRRLVWENGAEAFGFSAEDPASLRGPQFDAAWADELCYWAKPDETLQTLEHALRLGDAPQLLVTTTPRPIPALRALMGQVGAGITRASTWANAHNLAPGFVHAMRETFTGSALQRQELLGEVIEDLPGALWSRAMIESVRAEAPAQMDEVIVAIDPPAGIGERADACGIIAAGVSGKIAYVLADATVQGASPSELAARAAALARSVGAWAIVAEANQGGEMVREVLRIAAPGAHVILVRAHHSKHRRALPVLAHYQQGLVRHAASLPALEDEMCAFGADESGKSPDRVDALVWALSHLLTQRAHPRMSLL